MYRTLTKLSLCFTSLGLFSGMNVLAQTPHLIANTVHQEQLMHQTTVYSLFQISAPRNAQIDAEINNVVYLKLDPVALAALRNDKAPLISFSIPAANGSHKFTLNSFNILDEGFKVYERGSDGVKREAVVETGAFYRGILTGDDNSLAAFTFNKDEIAAVFSTEDGGNYNLVLNYLDPGANRENYLLFREADIKQARQFSCGVTEQMNKIRAGQGSVAGKNAYSSCHKLRVAMHGDYKLYQRKSNNLANSVTYLTNLFNVISALYNNEGINAVMSEAVVNTAADGYTYGGSDEVLLHFGDVMQGGINGDIAHLVSGYRQGNFAPLGGLAWLDVLCSTPTSFPDGSGGTMWVGPFSMANDDIMNNIPQIPVYSWDVEASSHEMGHNIGSPHTQSCTWTGGPIDNCVPVEDGNCSAGPNPAASGGTIMSYCHLTSWGINFALGFGPLPGDLIREKMNEQPCLAGLQPVKTIATASITRIANRQCDDGVWKYFYYDNNTATSDDDELLLMIKTNGQNIGDVDAAAMQVKMTTTADYGSNTGRAVTAPYAAAGWKEVNRTWDVTLPGAQPASAVSIRFPFTNQDVLDVKGSIPTLTQASQMSVVAFKSQSAAANPATATASSVSIYSNAGTADATHWQLGTTANYSYAEFVSSYGIFGGSIGFKPPAPSAIGDINAEDNKLLVYPNPVNTELNLLIPEAIRSGKYHVEVVDHLGRILLQKEGAVSADRNVTLNMSGFAAGVYHVRYITENASLNTMFLKK